MTESDLDACLRERLDEFGISRLADTTGLDYTGVPTYSCVRPGTSDSIWVYSGKGWTREAARIACIMECLERTAFLWCRIPHEFRVATESEISAAGPYWGPDRFTESLSVGYTPEDKIPWLLAARVRYEPVWVPADLVLMGFRSNIWGRRPFDVYTSNGYAAAFSLEAAIEHATFELIERHVVSLEELRSSHAPLARLIRMADALGLPVANISEQFRDAAVSAVAIDTQSVLRSLPLRSPFLTRSSSELAVKLIPNDFGIFVATAALAEQLDIDSVLAVAGYCASRSQARALQKAVLEMCQSRATDRQGSREDCGIDEKARHRKMPAHHWLLNDSAQVTTTQSAADSLESDATAFELLARGGFSEVAFVAVEPWPGIHCARVLVPGIETWHATGGRSRISDPTILCEPQRRKN